MNTKQNRLYTEEFKMQVIKLCENGKRPSEIAKDYDISPSTIHTWIKRFRNSGSLEKSDNLSGQEKELIFLRKQNKQLLMENDILKQAALIMARK